MLNDSLPLGSRVRIVAGVFPETEYPHDLVGREGTITEYGALYAYGVALDNYDMPAEWGGALLVDADEIEAL